MIYHLDTAHIVLLFVDDLNLGSNLFIQNYTLRMMLLLLCDGNTVTIEPIVVILQVI